MNASRRRAASAIAAFAVSWSLAAPALAAGPQPWNEQAFQAAQAAGNPVLVDIYANW